MCHEENIHHQPHEFLLKVMSMCFPQFRSKQRFLIQHQSKIRPFGVKVLEISLDLEGLMKAQRYFLGHYVPRDLHQSYSEAVS